MKFYISGPITGVDNFAAEFIRAEQVIQRLGHTAENPVHIGSSLRQRNAALGLPEPRWNDYMKADIAALMKCDAVVAIGDFWHSRGAMVELRVAEALGYPIFEMRNNCIIRPLRLNKVL